MTAVIGDLTIVAHSDESSRQRLAHKLAASLHARLAGSDEVSSDRWRLVVHDHALELLAPGMKTGRGMTIDWRSLDLRTGSGGLSRKQPIARAFGRTVRMIVDATAGTGQDAVLLAALGYDVTAIERSPILAAMLSDARDLSKRDETFRQAIGDRLRFVEGDSRDVLAAIAPAPDAVFIDPMFPPKKRASALPRKELQMLRRIVGDDPDAAELFAIAQQTAKKRIVVKRPTHAPPLEAKPTMQFEGKLVRYDVYVGGDRGQGTGSKELVFQVGSFCENELCIVMADSWFYLASVPPAGERAVLDERESRHAAGARRLRAGESITVFDGRGRAAAASIVAASGKAIEIELGESHVQPPLVPELHLAAALPKGDRQSVMLNMATQLGMASFTPLRCERAIVKPGRGFADRAERICLEACKQSRNARLPQIREPRDIPDLLRDSENERATALLAHPGGTPIAEVTTQLRTSDRIMVMVGPEGGFTNDEIDQARIAGAMMVDLGRTIMRTETAAVATISFLRLSFAGGA